MSGSALDPAFSIGRPKTMDQIQTLTDDPIITNLAYNELGELLITAHLPDGTDASRSGGLMVPPKPFALIYNHFTREWAVTNIITPVDDGFKIISLQY